ncbi:hypothetical protein GJ496_010481, partial [Pomphorhynchus laevis]
ISQSVFALCSFKANSPKTYQRLLIRHYTVDYINPIEGLCSKYANYFLSVSKDSELIYFATENESTQQLWVQALYQATGQSHKPKQLDKFSMRKTKSIESNRSIDKNIMLIDTAISTNPVTSDHMAIFELLLQKILTYRLNACVCSMGWLSPAQTFILKEYSLRYGVHQYFVNICYLSALIEEYRSGSYIDTSLLYYVYTLCTYFTNRLNSSTARGKSQLIAITLQEQDKFEQCQKNLICILEYMLTHFRNVFPFGLPSDGLKFAIALLIKIQFRLQLCNQIEVDHSILENCILIRCVREGALIDYTDITKNIGLDDPPSVEDSLLSNAKIDQFRKLVDVCIDHVEIITTFYEPSFVHHYQLMAEYLETFWTLFITDIAQFVRLFDDFDYSNILKVFRTINLSLSISRHLKDSKFHSHLTNIFSSIVVRIIDDEEYEVMQLIGSIEESDFTNKFSLKHNAISQLLFRKLESLKDLLVQLEFTDHLFAAHVQLRLCRVVIDSVTKFAEFINKVFISSIRSFASNKSTFTSNDIIPDECYNAISCICTCRMKVNKLMIDHHWRISDARYLNQTDEKKSFIFGNDKTNDKDVTTHESITIADENKHLSIIISSIQELQNKIETNLYSTLTSMLNSTVNQLLECQNNILFRILKSQTSSFINNIFSIKKPIIESPETYQNFLRANLEKLEQTVTDRVYFLSLSEIWYNKQLQTMWKCIEHSNSELTLNQIESLKAVLQKIEYEFKLCGIQQTLPECTTYKQIKIKLSSLG